MSVSDIADAVESGLKRACEERDLEQSVYGLDCLDEVALHPVIEHSLKEAGFGVHREQRYPADRRRRSQSEGERCDFVLTPEGRPLAQPDAEGTLFDPLDAVNLAEAFWLEVKIVSQFGVDGPNKSYTSNLLSTVRQDVSKLSKDEGILHAALLLILFVRDQAVADHDLVIWQDHCLNRSLPIGAPARRFLTMTDRHGNDVCAIAIYPVSHL